MSQHKSAGDTRVNELNHCKKLLHEAMKRVTGTHAGVNVYGLRHAVGILMERKKQIREIQAEAKNKPSESREDRPWELAEIIQRRRKTNGPEQKP